MILVHIVDNIESSHSSADDENEAKAEIADWVEERTGERPDTGLPVDEFLTGVNERMAPYTAEIICL